MVGGQQLRGQKVEALACFDHSLLDQLVFEVVFEVGSLTGVDVHRLDGEHFQHFFLNDYSDLLRIVALSQPLLTSDNAPGQGVVPAER